MKDLENRLRIYAITDGSWGDDFFTTLEGLLKDGVTMVQIREKNLSRDEYVAKAVKAKALCQGYGVPLIVNDSIEVAALAKADGVHLGQGDGTPEAARRILGPAAIVGVTAKTPEQIKAAEGADYIGSGALFPTETKKDAKAMDFDYFDSLCRMTEIPVVAIGGINAENVHLLKGLPMKGFAISGGLLDEDGRSQVRELKEEIDKIL